MFVGLISQRQRQLWVPWSNSFSMRWLLWHISNSSLEKSFCIYGCSEYVLKHSQLPALHKDKKHLVANLNLGHKLQKVVVTNQSQELWKSFQKQMVEFDCKNVMLLIKANVEWRRYLKTLRSVCEISHMKVWVRYRGKNLSVQYR